MNNIARRDLVFEAQFCGIKLGNLDWNQRKYLKVYGFSDGLYNSDDRSTYIRVSTKSVSVFNEFWNGTKIPDIKVNKLAHHLLLFFHIPVKDWGFFLSIKMLEY